jgi:hydrogenase maturation protein HypF
LLEQAGVDWRSWKHEGLLGDKKAKILSKVAASSPKTSSLGRVLDALSCYLGIGTSRTYDGEPAMRLEQVLAAGKPRFALEHEEPAYDDSRKARVVRLAPLFRQLHEMAVRREPDGKATADMARSFVECIVDQMVDIAAERAEKEGIRKVGLTGGVSYNLPLCEIVVKRLEERGLAPLLHDRIPNGDGGISAGQNAIAGIKGRYD